MKLRGLGSCILVLAFASGPGLPASEMDAAGAALVERVLARHDGFRLNIALRTADGRSFREGVYDVAVIESGDVYFLQLIHRQTRRGLRILATLSGHAESRIATSDETEMASRTQSGGIVITFKTPSFTVESILARG
jgi:hypothetical protein